MTTPDERHNDDRYREHLKWAREQFELWSCIAIDPETGEPRDAEGQRNQDRLVRDLADVRVKLDRANGYLECALVLLRFTNSGAPLLQRIHEHLACIPRKERAS